MQTEHKDRYTWNPKNDEIIFVIHNFVESLSYEHRHMCGNINNLDDSR
jgi:hypothetical protein